MGRSGPQCTICRHEKRVSIELAIVHGVSAPVLAARFACSKFAIIRHSKAHLSPAQKAALLSATTPSKVDVEALRTSESENILHGLVAQRVRLHSYAERAAEFGNFAGAIAAENSIQHNLALVARLVGQLTQRIDVRHTNLLVSPDWLRLRQTLIAALKPYPDASRAVARAVLEAEAAAATEITAATKPPLVIEHQPAPVSVPPPPPFPC